MHTPFDSLTNFDLSAYLHSVNLCSNLHPIVENYFHFTLRRYYEKFVFHQSCLTGTKNQGIKKIPTSQKLKSICLATIPYIVPVRYWEYFSNLRS